MNSSKLGDEAGAIVSKRSKISQPGTSSLPRELLAGIVLLLVGMLVFRDFVFGEKVLLYKDAGSDSINDYYPWFAHLSDYLRSTGLPSWSFFVGMGQPIYYAIGYLILDPVVWLPKAWIAHALVYQHLCKILVAALILLRFFQLRG